MKAIGPLLVATSGDRQVALDRLGLARSCLGRMKAYLGGSDGAKTWRFSDGTVIRTRVAGANEIVNIDVRGVAAGCDPLDLDFLQGFFYSVTPKFGEATSFVAAPSKDEPGFDLWSDKRTTISEDPKKVSRGYKLAVVDACKNVGPWYEQIVSGRLNWYSKELGLRWMISWRGPPSRYFFFPDQINTTGSNIETLLTNQLGSALFYGGFVLTTLESDAKILGAAVEVVGEEKHLLVAQYVNLTRFKIRRSSPLPKRIIFSKLKRLQKAELKGLPLTWTDVCEIDVPAVRGFVSAAWPRQLLSPVLFSQDATKVAFTSRGGITSIIDPDGNSLIIAPHELNASTATLDGQVTVIQTEIIERAENRKHYKDFLPEETICSFLAEYTTHSSDGEHAQTHQVGAVKGRTLSYTLSPSISVTPTGSLSEPLRAASYDIRWPVAIDFDHNNIPVVMESKIYQEPFRHTHDFEGSGFTSIWWWSKWPEDAPTPVPGPQTPQSVCDPSSQTYATHSGFVYTVETSDFGAPVTYVFETPYTFNYHSEFTNRRTERSYLIDGQSIESFVHIERPGRLQYQLVNYEWDTQNRVLSYSGSEARYLRSTIVGMDLRRRALLLTDQFAEGLVELYNRVRLVVDGQTFSVTGTTPAGTPPFRENTTPAPLIVEAPSADIWGATASGSLMRLSSLPDGQLLASAGQGNFGRAVGTWLFGKDGAPLSVEDELGPDPSSNSVFAPITTI
jgi:hypothetical protein